MLSAKATVGCPLLKRFTSAHVCLFRQSNFMCIGQRNSVVRAFTVDASHPDEEQHKQQQLSDTPLYKESQQLTIRMMLGVSVVNAVYWSNQLVQYALYKDVVIQGINLGGDPTWAYFGSIATGAIVYFSRTYAHHSVYQCYESQDRLRIGFQVHTILGYPGRKFEVKIGNARFISKSNPIMTSVYGDDNSNITNSKQGVLNHLLKTSMIPIVVDGFEGNLLLDEHGFYTDKKRLAELLSVDTKKMVDSKQLRVQWNQQVKGRKRLPKR